MSTAFFEQQKTCPVCQKKFAVTRVRSSACYVVKRESDFNVLYRDKNPLHYNVWVCPFCYYAAPEKNFAEELRPAEIDRLQKGLNMLKTDEPDLSGERSPAVALRSFELAIRSAQIRQAGPGLKASLFLRAAWICREMGKVDQEHQYLKEALALYKESFEKEVNLSSRLSDVRLMYIIGELNLRLANYDESIQWFSRAVMNKDIKREPELERQLRDQWETARQKRKESGSPVTGNEQGNDITPESSTESSAPAEPVNSTVEQTTPISVTRHRNKVKMFAGVYDNQVEWLKDLSNVCYNKTQVLLGKEAVLRAVLDAVMECQLKIEGADTEEGLKQQIIESLQK